MYKKIAFLKDSVSNNILLLVFLTIPLWPITNKVAIILWIITAVISFEKNQVIILIKRKEIILFIVFYFITTIGVFYSLNIRIGISKIGTQASILLFPLFLGTKCFIDKEMREKVLFAFILGCILAGLICILYALNFYLINEKLFIVDSFGRNQNVFYYKRFSHVLDIHPTYLSICMGFSLIIILNKLLFKNKKLKKIFFLTAFIFLLVVNFLLASKAGMLSFLIVLTVYLLFFFLRTTSHKSKRLVLFVVLLVVALFYYNSTLNKRFDQAFLSLNEKISNNHTVNDPLGIRLMLWENSIDASKNNLILGYGTGSTKEVLYKECLKQNYFTDCEKMRGMNSHNQFFDTLVSNGLLGLSALLFILFLIFKNAIIRRDVIYLSFLMIFSFNMLFESLLQREKGIILFMAFSSFFIANSYCLNENNRNER